MLLGPACFLLLAAVVVMFDPLVVMGTPDWDDAAGGRAPGIPAQRQVPSFGTYADPASFHSRPRDAVGPADW